MDRTGYTELEQLPNIGPAGAGDLRLLGIAVPVDLIGQDPYLMYENLCTITNKRHDPCVIDVFISAVRFMGGAESKPWWFYTAERKAKLAVESSKRQQS